MKNGGGGKLNHSLAFTLAEVLITLGIIGIVAAMTMPTLIQKHQEKVTVTKLKKAYSIISQAYLRAQSEYGNINNWGFSAKSEITDEDSSSYDNNMDLFWFKLIPYMNVTSFCLNSTTKPCPISGQYNLDGTRRSKNNDTTIKLTDGMTFMGGWLSDINCQDNYCFEFAVDINGADALPNTVGKDVFYFNIYKNKIVPQGHQRAPKNESTFEKDCLNGGNGYGCAAWVIFNENMDYLHCNDLSWDGKKKCK